MQDLIDAVDAAFGATRGDLADWPDPHPDRAPADEEYSRVSDPGKYRIVGARADAWRTVLVGAGLASVVEGPATWQTAPGTIVSRTETLVPTRADALPLVLARSAIDAVADAGLTVGVGNPAALFDIVPDCGCDACDSGSRDLIDVVDRMVWSVVSGRFRRLTSGDREIVAFVDGWRASGRFGRSEVEAVLDRADRWTELTGAPWIQPDAS